MKKILSQLVDATCVLREERVCYYMFINISPCHSTYYVPLFCICGYYYVQTTALLKVIDI